MRAAHLKPRAVVSRAPTATPLGYLPSPGISHQPRPTPTPSQSDSTSPTRTLSSQAPSPSPSREVAPQQAPATSVMLEMGMRAVHIAATPKNTRQNDAAIARGRTADRFGHKSQQARAKPQRRPSDRPLHLQGLLGIDDNSSASSMTSYWDDVESILPESVLAAAERDGMSSHSTFFLKVFDVIYRL